MLGDLLALLRKLVKLSAFYENPCTRQIDSYERGSCVKRGQQAPNRGLARLGAGGSDLGAQFGWNEHHPLVPIGGYGNA